jgi:hypothetical protein
MADPGVGKSLLFYEFKAQAHSGCLVLEAYSVSRGKASAYLPLIELLREYFESGADDADRKRRERILGKVLGLDRTLEDTLAYFYSLLGIIEPDDSLAQIDPNIKRRRTLEAIKPLRIGANSPTVDEVAAPGFPYLYKRAPDAGLIQGNGEAVMRGWN